MCEWPSSTLLVYRTVEPEPEVVGGSAGVSFVEPLPYP
jgi:hypothetical protein